MGAEVKQSVCGIGLSTHICCALQVLPSGLTFDRAGGWWVCDAARYQSHDSQSTLFEAEIPPGSESDNVLVLLGSFAGAWP